MTRSTAVHRTRASLAVIVAAAVTVSACGSSDNAGESAGASGSAAVGGEIRYQTYQGPDIVKVWDSQWSDLKKSTGISVTTETVPQNEQSQRLLTQAASGELPDVAMISAQWFRILASKGLLEPLDQSQFSDVKIDDMQKVLLDAYSFDGKLYGLPTDLDMGVLFYNKDLFKKAGVAEPSPDWTWHDFADTAKALTKGDGSGKQFGADIGASIGNYPFLSTIANSYGGELIDTASGTATVDQAAGRRALELWDRMVVKDQSAPGIGSDASIVNGNIAMGVYGPWAAYYFLKDAKFDWGVTSLPMGDEPATWAWGSVMVVFKNSANKASALKFVDNFLSKPLMSQRADDWAWTPPSQSLLTDASFRASKALNLTADQKSMLATSLTTAKAPALVDEQVAVAKALDEQLSALQADSADLDQVVSQLTQAWAPLVANQ
jgi:multiple sugar transport system substrate-binding protein